MRRREFVAGGAALAVGAAAFPTWTSAQSTSARRIERIIDAHCHIFNAADLPIEGFARKVMVPKTVRTNELLARFAEYPGALEALLHAVAVQVKRGGADITGGDRRDRRVRKESRQETDARMAQGRGPQTTAKRVPTHLVQLGDFRQSRPFTARGPSAWNCDRARPAVSVAAKPSGHDWPGSVSVLVL